MYNAQKPRPPVLHNQAPQNTVVFPSSYVCFGAAHWSIFCNGTFHFIVCMPHPYKCEVLITESLFYFILSPPYVPLSLQPCIFLFSLSSLFPFIYPYQHILINHTPVTTNLFFLTVTSYVMHPPHTTNHPQAFYFQSICIFLHSLVSLLCSHLSSWITISWQQSSLIQELTPKQSFLWLQHNLKTAGTP